MQNDILLFCNNSKLSDKVSLEYLHKNAHLLRLKQRRQKHLLMLVYIYPKKMIMSDIYVNTRPVRMENFVFKTETKIGTNTKIVNSIKVPTCGILYLIMFNAVMIIL